MGRKRAYLLYKAALKESLTPGVEWETPGGEVPPPTHPYMLALGVLSIQKVCICFLNTHPPPNPPIDHISEINHYIDYFSLTYCYESHLDGSLGQRQKYKNGMCLSQLVSSRVSQ